MRKDCVFASLSEKDQADLFDWISHETYDAVLKRVARPRPAGFGIRTHTNSLRRFFEERQAQHRLRDLANVMARPPAIIPSSTQPATPPIAASAPAPTAQNVFYSAAADAHAHASYVLANSPMTLAIFRALTRALQQNTDAALKREHLELSRRHLDLARDRFDFERAQFEYDVARAAIALLPELIAIDETKGIDEEDKIQRVRQRLFGQAQSGSVSVAAASLGVSPNGSDQPSVTSVSSVVKNSASEKLSTLNS